MKLRWFIPVMTVLFLGSWYGFVSCQTNRPKNIKVLDELKDATIEEIKESMRLYTLSMGVECDYCHNKDDYASDEKKEKNISRDMMRMTRSLNDGIFKNAKESVTCYTCHRGAVKIKNIPPGL